MLPDSSLHVQALRDAESDLKDGKLQGWPLRALERLYRKVGQELAASQQTKLDQALSEAQSRADHET